MAYAGQNKVSKEIDAKVKKLNAESEATKMAKDAKRKLYYYNKLRKNNPNNTL